LIWAPTLVLLGDHLVQLLGQESLATKILYIVIAAVALAVFGNWLRGRLMSN